ncbi:MAG: hypothetical protein WCL06_01700 [Bacteroidota bacterium]
MSSKSETGHIINLSLAREIISTCNSYGAEYQPTNPLISIASMTNITDMAYSLNDIYTDKLMKYKTCVNKKAEMVKRLKVLAKKSVSSYASSNEVEKNIDVAKSYLRKITGSNVRKKRDKNHEVLPGHVSNCQMSIENLMDHFDKLLYWYEGRPIYCPMEEDIKVASMRDFLVELQAVVKEVIEYKIDADNARFERDECMYLEGTGLVDVTLLCKKYVSSVFGARSDKTRMVTKHRLRRMMKIQK